MTTKDKGSKYAKFAQQARREVRRLLRGQEEGIVEETFDEERELDIEEEFPAVDKTKDDAVEEPTSSIHKELKVSRIRIKREPEKK